MKDLILNIRINAAEKEAISMAAKNLGMPISAYIKFRVFHSNPDLSAEDFTYDCPDGNIHNYNSLGAIYLNHYLIRHMIQKMYPNDESDIYTESFKDAVKKINSYGYRKINTKEDGDETC